MSVLWYTENVQSPIVVLLVATLLSCLSASLARTWKRGKPQWNFTISWKGDAKMIFISALLMVGVGILGRMTQ